MTELMFYLPLLVKTHVFAGKFVSGAIASAYISSRIKSTPQVIE
ncbi:hypothetical protein B6N60_01987 [Richelia sinica FACHB-800]|uniref:Uncharacterized protein n=1 Tax=Richelia sinica FACHB-800 TaxID=1357546 RepID=A0A975T895_9NOST|nr:hypothetical protein B6N60_01987 [Richelia sinica FACHB-800]